MSAERLKDILNTMADETQDASLEVAAMREARQMTARRAAAGAAAAVLLVIGGFIGAVNVLGNQGASPVDPAASSEPTPDSSRLDGTYYYLDLPETGTYRLVEWSPDGEPRASDLGTADDIALETINVSPDGKYASWAQYADSSASVAEIMVLDIAADRPMMIGEVGVDDAFCREPVWDPYGRPMLLYPTAEGMDWYSVEDESPSDGFTFHGCHARPVTPGDYEVELYFLDVENANVSHIDGEGTVTPLDLEYSGQIGNLAWAFGDMLGVKPTYEGPDEYAGHRRAVESESVLNADDGTAMQALYATHPFIWFSTEDGPRGLSRLTDNEGATVVQLISPDGASLAQFTPPAGVDLGTLLGYVPPGD